MIVALNRYEQIRIVSRLKECGSSVDALRRRQEQRRFDENMFEEYSLTGLRDLVGVRVMVFPRHRISEVDSALQPLLSAWTSDPIPGIGPETPPLALKYYGRCASATTTITSEVQVVSSLIGSFWEVEHSAVYKASPDLQGVMASPSMSERQAAVFAALRDFEIEFERLVSEARELRD